MLMAVTLPGDLTFSLDFNKASFADTLLTTTGHAMGTVMVTALFANLLQLLVGVTLLLALNSWYAGIINANVVSWTEATLGTCFRSRAIALYTVLFTLTTTRLVDLVAVTCLRASLVFGANSVDPRPARLTEASGFACFIAHFTLDRTHFRAFVSALGIEFIVVLALVAFGVTHTFAINTNISGFTEAALFAFLVAFLASNGTGFLATVATLFVHLVVVLVTSMASLLALTLAMDSNVSRTTEAATLAFLTTVQSRNGTLFSATTATFSEKLIIAETLLASIVLHAMAVNTRIAGLTETANLTLLMAQAVREGTRL